jgi:hypothetical protein
METASISNDIASCHSKLPFSLSISRARETVFGNSVTNLCVDLKHYLFAALMMRSRFFKVYVTHHAKSGMHSVPFAIIYSDTSMEKLSFTSEIRSQDVEPSFHSTHKSQTLVVFLRYCRLLWLQSFRHAAPPSHRCHDQQLTSTAAIDCLEYPTGTTYFLQLCLQYRPQTFHL